MNPGRMPCSANGPSESTDDTSTPAEIVWVDFAHGGRGALGVAQHGFGGVLLAVAHECDGHTVAGAEFGDGFLKLRGGVGGVGVEGGDDVAFPESGFACGR